MLRPFLDLPFSKRILKLQGFGYFKDFCEFQLFQFGTWDLGFQVTSTLKNHSGKTQTSEMVSQVAETNCLVIFLWKDLENRNFPPFWSSSSTLYCCTGSNSGKKFFLAIARELFEFCIDFSIEYELLFPSIILWLEYIPLLSWVLWSRNVIIKLFWQYKFLKKTHYTGQLRLKTTKSV